jgi:hypothetical protein
MRKVISTHSLMSAKAIVGSRFATMNELEEVVGSRSWQRELRMKVEA